METGIYGTIGWNSSEKTANNRKIWGKIHTHSTNSTKLPRLLYILITKDYQDYQITRITSITPHGTKDITKNAKIIFSYYYYHIWYTNLPVCTIKRYIKIKITTLDTQSKLNAKRPRRCLKVKLTLYLYTVLSTINIIP